MHADSTNYQRTETGYDGSRSRRAGLPPHDRCHVDFSKVFVVGHAGPDSFPSADALFD